MKLIFIIKIITFLNSHLDKITIYNKPLYLKTCRKKKKKNISYVVNIILISIQQLCPGKKSISQFSSVGKKASLASEIQLFVDDDGMIFRNPRIKAFTRGLV